MVIRIGFTSAFLHQADDLSSKLQEEIWERIDLFRDTKNHRFLKVHKLHGRMSDRYSFSVNYRIRIVFSYVKGNEVTLHGVGDHDIYE